MLSMLHYLELSLQPFKSVSKTHHVKSLTPFPGCFMFSEKWLMSLDHLDQSLRTTTGTDRSPLQWLSLLGPGHSPALAGSTWPFTTAPTPRWSLSCLHFHTLILLRDLSPGQLVYSAIAWTRSTTGQQNRTDWGEEF